MPDSKKVIEGLKKAAEELARYAPMKVNGRCQMYFDGAIHLLKEQEAVKPDAKDSDIRIDYNCGFCKRWFCYKSKIHPEMDFRTKYCPHCGRKVEWDAAD